MVKLWIQIDEQYPAYYVTTRENLVANTDPELLATDYLPEMLKNFDEEAVECTDEEAALVQEYQDVRKRYEIMCKMVLERNERWTPKR